MHDHGKGRWRFAIDAGGTFTDCIVFSNGPGGASDAGLTFSRLPESSSGGIECQYKILSSGSVPGTAGEGTAGCLLKDPRRKDDPDGFWQGFQIRLYDDTGQVAATTRVAAFCSSSATLTLEAAPEGMARGTRYALFCDLPAPIIGIRYLLGRGLERPLPPIDLRMGTTRGTNALLTRAGAATALVTTRGFGDILRIRDQQRPDLFQLAIQQPAPIFTDVLEVDERMSVAGDVLQPLDRLAVQKGLKRLQACGIQSLAICLLHGFAFPAHEQAIAAMAGDLGFADVSVSHRVAPMRKLVSRADTTVVNAYLNPVLQQYCHAIEQALGPEGRTRWMTSAGGLVPTDQFCGKDSILSGPAGGVIGFARSALAVGFPRSIGFDMGGTSTDVTLFDGTRQTMPQRVYETRIDDVHLSAPRMAIETVAAGGGSICEFDGVQIAVGPESAGADPGPACYGRGGPLTVTDMNLLLGRIREDRFPFPLDRAAVERKIDELCTRIAQATGNTYTRCAFAEGVVQLATAKMAESIRSISTAQGHDPRQYALVSFGGAGPQHACAVAQELEIRTVLIPSGAGVLSAQGIGQAPTIHHIDQGIYQPWNACRDSLGNLVADLIAQARDQRDPAFQSDAGADHSMVEQVEVDLRYQGQDACLTMPFDPPSSLVERFGQQHQRRYGYVHPERAIEVVAVHVTVTANGAIDSVGKTRAMTESSARDSVASILTSPQPEQSTVQPIAHAMTVFDGRSRKAEVHDRETLCPGDVVKGPAIIAEPLSTIVIHPDWSAYVLEDRTLLIRSDDPRDAAPDPTVVARSTSDKRLDPISLEVLNNAFAGIADQMGQMLRNIAISVNVKERLDFSCALFDRDGNLIVNAPHVPVHLGAMSQTIRHVLQDHPDMAPGDVFVTNDPYRGGSHLPDVTVITPVFDSGNRQRLFFTASRAHHAEIGGSTPGSMPPFSKCLAEEGVLIPSQRVVARGQHQLETIRSVLANADYPSRAMDDNLSDIVAQIAANQQGAVRLGETMKRFGVETTVQAMEQLLATAEAKTRRALRRLGDRVFSFADQMDDGSPVAVRIVTRDGRATIDFTGSADVHPGNLNANRGIVHAAVIYVLRCLIDEPMPINQGILRAVRLVLPEGMLNPPDRGDSEKNAAIVGGNVETSQRIVDTLLGALELAAASQGTMNNLLFGDGSFGYYETIGGGAGATPGAKGASAVHTHMTNTRLTDPEILEARFPVRLRAFRIREGSGGNGLLTGGNGIIRQIEFLTPLTVSLLTQRRTTRPWGLHGGQPGASGENLLSRHGQEPEVLTGCCQVSVGPGDVLTIRTPGGGGYGTG